MVTLPENRCTVTEILSIESFEFITIPHCNCLSLSLLLRWKNERAHDSRTTYESFFANLTNFMMNDATRCHEEEQKPFAYI